MATVLENAGNVRVRIPAAASWSLVVGGFVWFVAGGMHPKEDPPDVTLKEHLRIMYENDAWHPSHPLFLLSTGLIALAWSPSYAAAPSRARAPGRRRRCGGHGRRHRRRSSSPCDGADAERFAAGEATPTADAQIVLEAVTAPTAGVATAILAVLGAVTRIRQPGRCCAGVVGGLAYTLAGGTFWFTDALKPLFPLAGLIGV